jgi:uncharacterized SAM-binding protein YcdF (DUF218 family)
MIRPPVAPQAAEIRPRIELGYNCVMISVDTRAFLKGLTLPPGGLIVLGVAGLVLIRRLPRTARWLCALSILGLWAFATPAVVDPLAQALERYPAFDPEQLTAAQRAAQAIVILGGGIREHAPEYGGDAPAGATLERLIEGAKVARITHLPVLVSGSPREAAAMRRFLIEDLQTPVQWLENASADTHENAVFSARILRAAGVGRIILVTSSLHLPRSVGEFERSGLLRAYVACYELGGRTVAALLPRRG